MNAAPSVSNTRESDTHSRDRLSVQHRLLPQFMPHRNACLAKDHRHGRRWQLYAPLESRRTAPDAPAPHPGGLRHPDFLYEVKFDGFRALAHVNGHHCQLVSRTGYVYKSWPYLAEEIAHAVRARSAILDGEIVCLGSDGRSRFYDLLFRREWPYFLAFDALAIDGDDLRALPLVESVRSRASCRALNSASCSSMRFVHAGHACTSSPAKGISRASWRSGPVEPTSATAVAHPG